MAKPDNSTKAFSVSGTSGYSHNYYDQLAEYEKSKFALHELKVALSKAKKISPPLVRPEVIDIGCGMGFAYKLTRETFEGAKYTGLERDQYSCERAQIFSGAPCIIGDAEDLAFGNNSADLILLVHLISHLNHPQRAFSEAFRVLRQYGQLILISPNRTCIELIVKPLERISKTVHHDETIVRYYDKSELIQMFNAAGFKIKYSCYNGWGLPFHGRLPSSPTLRFYGTDIIIIGQKT